MLMPACVTASIERKTHGKEAVPDLPVDGGLFQEPEETSVSRDVLGGRRPVSNKSPVCIET
jgi:hypothetical protein